MAAFRGAKLKCTESETSNISESTMVSTSQISHSQRNPWDHENPFIKNSKDALILAEKMNIKTQNETCARAIAELPSSKLITLQKELSTQRSTASKLKQDIATHKQYETCGDLLNLKIIEKRINRMKQMCNDLDTVLREKEKLINRLQTPFVGDFIKVEANYHRYVREVLSDLVPSIINVSPYLDNITWMAYRDLAAGKTEPLVVEIQSLMASLQTSYQMLYQMKSGIEGLSQKPENDEDANDGDQRYSSPR